MTAKPETVQSTPAARLRQPAAWFLYTAIGLEILFMISPAAVYFYSVYGPSLNVLEHFPATAWLTQFFLPHISTTRSAVLNALPWAGGGCALAGAAGFLIAAGQLYWNKLRRRAPVTTGLYAYFRHPQYAALALLGLGALLLWPRFLVLIAYVMMLFLYRSLAAFEERQCEQAFGDVYRVYRERIRQSWPLAWFRREFESAPPRIGGIGTAIALVTSVAVAVLIAFSLREYTLSKITARYEDGIAVLSPALLTDQELDAAYRTALEAVHKSQVNAGAGEAPLVIHVVPNDWRLADLPLETARGEGGHLTPSNFDRHRYQVLFSRARTHLPHAVGEDIVRSAYGIEPLALVRVDIEEHRATGFETPPPHVHWGDIPTPIY